jgi:hypothetical protein
VPGVQSTCVAFTNFVGPVSSCFTGKNPKIGADDAGSLIVDAQAIMNAIGCDRADRLPGSGKARPPMGGCPPEYNCRMPDALTGFLWLLAMLVVALVGAWLLVSVLFGKRP